MIGLGLLACIFLSACFSGLETGIYATSRLRIVLDAASGHAAARHLQGLLADLPRVLVVLLIANNLMNWGASFFVQVMLAEAALPHTELLGTLIVSAVLFVLGESAPKLLFRDGQHETLYRALPILRGAHALFGLLAVPLARLGPLILRSLPRRSGRLAAPVWDEVLGAGASEGLLSPFQQRVASGILALRQRVAADEAEPVGRHPVARLGIAGVQLPPAPVPHRVLVLDESGTHVLGWIPLARLAEPEGFRAPLRHQLQPVARVARELGLDRAYTVLDRSGAPFAVLEGPGPLAVVEASRLRRRVMGTFDAAVASTPGAT